MSILNKMYEDERQTLLSKYKFVDSIFEAHKPKGLLLFFLLIIVISIIFFGIV